MRMQLKCSSLDFASDGFSRTVEQGQIGVCFSFVGDFVIKRLASLLHSFQNPSTPLAPLLLLGVLL
jgi:hypothetical protein